MISPGSQATPILFRGPGKGMHVSKSEAQVTISIFREQRIRGDILGSLTSTRVSRLLDKGNYSRCSERVRKPIINAWDPLFSPGVPPTPRTRVVHPLLGVRRPGRPCAVVCLRAHGWPLRVRLDTDPVHTYRGAGRGDGERRTSWHGSCHACARALQRKEVRVARSVTKFTALALRCVQCT